MPKSPFQKASLYHKRLKILAWGESGVGKTLFALKFPQAVVIDMENGTDHYGELGFDVMKTTSWDEALKAVRWLATNDHEYRTLVIDPLTIYWQSLQRKWSDIFLKRRAGTAGHKIEFYDFQVRDWMTIKADFQVLINLLIEMDMNVVVTCRAKKEYADGNHTQVIGSTYDCEKNTEYPFDIILRLYRREEKYMVLTQEDRTRQLPHTWVNDFDFLAGKYGDILIAKAKPITEVPEDETIEDKPPATEGNGKPADMQIKYIQDYWYNHDRGATADPEVVKLIKAANVQSPGDLSYAQAKEICQLITQVVRKETSNVEAES